jgi:hypothetical protein
MNANTPHATNGKDQAMAMPTLAQVQEFMDSLVDSEDFDPARAALFVMDHICEILENSGLLDTMSPAEIKAFDTINEALNEGLGV